MKKHQFVKVDCDCPHRETLFTCKHCGEMEYASPEQMRRLDAFHAACTGENAPSADLMEILGAQNGGAFDCLAQEQE